MDWTTVLYSVIFAIANPWAFFELRRTASAGKERLTRAREELLDLLETHLTANGMIPAEVFHEITLALAQKRQVKVDAIYRPMITLHDLLLRANINPAVTAEQRVTFVSAIRNLIIELKANEGMKLVHEAIEATPGAASMSDRPRAKMLLLQLANNWVTFDDQTELATLQYLSSRLGSIKNRETTLRVLGGLRDRWRLV